MHWSKWMVHFKWSIVWAPTQPFFHLRIFVWGGIWTQVSQLRSWRSIHCSMSSHSWLQRMLVNKQTNNSNNDHLLTKVTFGVLFIFFFVYLFHIKSNYHNLLFLRLYYITSDLYWLMKVVPTLLFECTRRR
jgi:hypothetical protein